MAKTLIQKSIHGSTIPHVELFRVPMTQKMIPTQAILSLALFMLLAILPTNEIRADETRPNVILIMGDDMGYTDIGCYGGEIATPALDKLAANGIRFTQFYNCARCCPTRASLLTGLYSHQAGIGLMTENLGYDAYQGDLNESCVTIAEVLGAAGYRNYLSGKWHVTKHTQPSGPNHNWPLQRGFDDFYGTIIGAGSFYDPATLCRGNQFITPDNDTDYQPETFHYTQAISDHAVEFLKQHETDHSDQPFFLYVSYTAAHWPMHALEKDIAKYRGKYAEGYQAIRQARYERAAQLGVIDPQWKLSPPAWDWQETDNLDWEQACMEVYAAMIDQMDQGIASIVSQLEEQDKLENTIIIYLQDNGGCAEWFGRASNADDKDKFDYKPFAADDLQTKIWPPMQTRAGNWVRTGPEVTPGPADTFIAYGIGWANTSNTPFRGYKHDNYEGGISTPFIVHWPAGIQSAQRNSIVDSPCHLIDVMPTLSELCRAPYPANFQGKAIQPMAGVSLQPTLIGRPLKRTQPIAFEHHGNLALRDGRWKIVSQYKKDHPTTWELYDMQADRTEQNDLADTMPEKVKELSSRWQSWADRVGVQPWPVQKKD